MDKNTSNVTEADLENAASNLNEAEGREASQRGSSEVVSDKDSLGEGGKRALKAEREARKQAERENAEMRARLEKFEDAQRSEEERREHELKKLRESAEDAELRASSAEQQLSELQHRMLAGRIAREVGLPDEMADRLRGDSEDELREDAEALKQSIGGRRPRFPVVPEAGAAFSQPMTNAQRFVSSFGSLIDNA